LHHVAHGHLPMRTYQEHKVGIVAFQGFRDFIA
jgi:hypothetical protein